MKRAGSPLQSRLRLSLVALLSTLAIASAGAQSAPTLEEEHHLGRFGYGYSGWALKRYRELGKQAYVEEQLHPERIQDRPMQRALADPQLEVLTLTLPQLRARFGGNGQPEPAFKARVAAQVGLLLRAKVSRRQLEALLTEFWFNHFNVYLTGNATVYTVPYLRDTIRPRVLGRFEDLLLAVAQSPAMLRHLDNTNNYREGYVRKNRTHGINETYARQLLERHTLGADENAGHYTRADVTALARCLTGWTLDFNKSSPTGFRFARAGHDTGAKELFGLKLAAGGGVDEGTQVLKALAQHPRTARFIAGELVRFFVGPEQSELTERAAQVYRETQGDLREVLRTILLSEELSASKDGKLKRPLLLLVSAMRSVGVDLGYGEQRFDRLQDLAAGLKRLGQPLLELPGPAGWNDADASWLGEGYAVERMATLAEWLGSPGRVAKVHCPDPGGTHEELAARVLARVLGKGGAAPTSAAAVRAYLKSVPEAKAEQRYRSALALVFSSREFNRY